MGKGSSIVTSTPGYIMLLGSGETSPSIRSVYQWLFNQIDEPIRATILETPAGFEPNSSYVAGQIGEFLKKRLQNFKPSISLIPARKRNTAFSPDDPQIIGPLYDANVIMMGPGSPSYAIRQLQDSLAWHTLQACHRLGASLVFSSATTIASGICAMPVYEIYKVGEDLHWKPGLNFFGHFGLSLTFVPHWNNTDGGADLDTSRCYIGQDRFKQLVDMLTGEQTIVGIDENTALVINPAEGTCQAMGAGHITIVRSQDEVSFNSGEIFSADLLGPFKIPASDSGVPADIWHETQAQVLSATRSRQTKPTPTPEVNHLVEARIEARNKKDWQAADTLRDQIAALGWTVRDAPDGVILEPIGDQTV